jgi:hypothetical protein
MKILVQQARALRVRVLAPKAADLAARRTDESRVMKLAYGKTSALLGRRREPVRTPNRG